MNDNLENLAKESELICGGLACVIIECKDETLNSIVGLPPSECLAIRLLEKHNEWINHEGEKTIRLHGERRIEGKTE